MLFIILEGPDRTGKSTLALQLEQAAKRLTMSTIDLRHASQPTSHPLQEYVLSLEDESRWMPKIFDRWHLGQWVYPRLMPGRPDPLTDGQLLWVELFLRSRGAFLVSMWDSDARIEERVAEDDDSYLRKERVVDCSRLFLDAWYRSILPGISTDLPNADPKVIVQDAVAAHLRYCGSKDAPRYMIGNTYDPDLILVGDELGRPNPPEATHRMPFAPYPMSSGAYLMSTLLTTRLTRRIAIVNSLNPSGEVANIQKIAQTYPHARFLALGNEAWTRIAMADIDWVRIGAVPHPQFVRRFHFKRMFEYARMIEEAGLEGADLRRRWIDA